MLAAACVVPLGVGLPHEQGTLFEPDLFAEAFNSSREHESLERLHPTSHARRSEHGLAGHSLERERERENVITELLFGYDSFPHWDGDACLVGAPAQFQGECKYTPSGSFVVPSMLKTAFHHMGLKECDNAAQCTCSGCDELNARLAEGQPLFDVDGKPIGEVSCAPPPGCHPVAFWRFASLSDLPSSSLVLGHSSRPPPSHLTTLCPARDADHTPSKWVSRINAADLMYKKFSGLKKLTQSLTDKINEAQTEYEKAHNEPKPAMVRMRRAESRMRKLEQKKNYYTRQVCQMHYQHRRGLSLIPGPTIAVNDHNPTFVALLPLLSRPSVPICPGPPFAR